MTRHTLTGQVWLTITHNPHGSSFVRIDRADPKALIGADLLEQATDGRFPGVTVSGDQLDVITIADNYGQRFIYRLGDYDETTDAFCIEWPD